MRWNPVPESSGPGGAARRRPSQRGRAGRAALALGVTASLALTAAAAGGQDDVGFVLEMRGQWLVEGTPPRAIAEGDRLPAEAKVRPKEPDAKAKKKGGAAPALTVSLYTGKAAVYTGPATLPPRPSASLANRVWEVVTGKGMGGYAHLLSRALGDDAVARLDGETLDLTPVLKGPATDDYRLRFDRLVPGGGGAPVEVKVARGATSCRADGLLPGLYEVTVLASEGREAGRTWVLFTPPSGYDRAARTYAEAVALSEKWDPNVSPRAVTRFRRACLWSLAEHPEP
jgi:hypothetical protein